MHAFSRSARKAEFYDSFHEALHKGKAKGLLQPDSDRKIKISVLFDLKQAEQAETYKEHIAFGLSKEARELLRQMAVEEGNRLLEGFDVVPKKNTPKNKVIPKKPSSRSDPNDKPKVKEKSPATAPPISFSASKGMTKLERIGAELKKSFDEKTTQKLMLMAQDLLEHPDSPEKWQNDWKRTMLFIGGAVQKSATLSALAQERGLVTPK